LEQVGKKGHGKAWLWKGRAKAKAGRHFSPLVANGSRRPPESAVVQTKQLTGIDFNCCFSEHIPDHFVLSWRDTFFLGRKYGKDMAKIWRSSARLRRAPAALPAPKIVQTF
jgi:hypothetical protein